MMSLKRPSRYDTEDELMQMQQDLLAGNDRPSAQVVSLDKCSSSEKSDNRKKKHCKDKASPVPMIVDDVKEQVLFDITERDVKLLKYCEPSTSVESFPEVPVIKCTNADVSADSRLVEEKGGTRKKSIFAKQMEKMKKSEQKVLSYEDTAAKDVPVSIGSRILDGSGLEDTADAVKIHKENMKKIESMKAEEIDKHRKELMAQLDIKTLQFLKSLRKRHQTDEAELQKVTDHHGASDTISYQLKANEDVKEDELPIPLDEAKKFVHMDKVEKDKLSWMTMLPKPKPIDRKTGYPARFNFEGRLLLPSEELTIDEGLHHHGEDQEFPGYTLEELYHLARSAFPAQQIIALKTLSMILANYWKGLFDDCLEENLLSQLLESGFVILLRIALDKTDESTVAAAVHALHNLVVNDVDQSCLDKVFSWSYGHHSPFLKPADAPEGSRVDSETTMKDVSDEEIVKMDVIKGLLRMDLLPRLRYILDILKPEASVVGHILGTLSRICQNSLEGAAQVMDCPHLMQTVFSEFLPSHWGIAESIQGKLCTVYQMPLYSAVRLIRMLASAGRHIAHRLVSNYKLPEILMCYHVIDPSDKKLPIPDALKLNLESFRTWKVLLNYGLATEIYESLFPVLFKQLQYCQTISLATANRDFEYEYAAEFLSCLEAVIFVPRANVMKRPSASSLNSLSWDQVHGLEMHVRLMFGKWLFELSTNATTSSGLAMIGSCISFLSSFYECVRHLPGYNAMEVIEKINDLMQSVVLPFVKSDGFKNLASLLSKHSCILYKGRSGNERDAETLCSLGSVMWAGDISPALQEGSPFPLFLALGRFLLTCSDYHYNLQNEVTIAFLCETTVLQYMKNFVEAHSSSLSAHWFTRFETLNLCCMVLLSAKQVRELKTSIDATIYHSAALILPSLILPGDSYMIHRLLSNCIFHAGFYFDEDDLSWAVKMIETQDPIPLLEVNGKEVLVFEGQIVTDTCRQISAIRSIYTPFAECIDSVERSWQRIEGQCHEVESLSSFSQAKKSFSEDWMFLPIMTLYDEVHSGKLVNSSDPSILDMVAKCLQWIHFLISFREEIFYSLSPASCFTNLATVFLAENDLFLDSHVHRGLYSSLKQLLKHHPPASLNFRNVSWLKKRIFLDCFKELLDQFEAVSYGDQLFSSYVLFPLQQGYDSAYKKLLFEEHIAALRLLSIPLQKMLVPIKNYLLPHETDIELLSSYCKLLISDQLRHSPVLYLMAVHHLNNFLFTEPRTKLKDGMLTQIWMLRHKDCARNLLHYRCSVETQTFQMEENVTLPDRVVLTLQSLGIQTN